MRHRIRFAADDSGLYSQKMKKSLFVTLFIFSFALGLRAQTEPDKTPPTAKSPTDSKKPAAQKQTAPLPSSGAKGGDATAKAKAEANAKPIDPSNFDTSVKPSDDFFFYANGGWIKRTEIPPDQTRWGSFNQLIERNNDALHGIA